MNATRKFLLFNLITVLVLAGCSQTNPAPIEPALRECPVELRQAGDTLRDPCDPDPDPDPDPQPQGLQIVSIEAMRAKAAQLGISPLEAGIPNIEEALSNPSVPIEALNYPQGTSSSEDFVRQLFQNGTWTILPPGQTSTPLPDDNGCKLTKVNAQYNPEDIVTFDRGAGLMYPGAVLQGQFINLGVGGALPIHIDETKRKPLYLTSQDLKVTELSPTGLSGDVYPTIATMIARAQAAGRVGVPAAVADVQVASTVDEAMTKFKLDTKLLGADLKAQLETTNTSNTNTVFIKITQSLFSVNVDLRGYKPVRGLFNDALTVGDLEALGRDNELGYDNLPTYVFKAIYGRVILLSVTSTASTSELKAAAEAKWKTTTASLDIKQKKIIETSVIKAFNYGDISDLGPDAFKTDAWKAILAQNPNNINPNALKPIGFTVNRWDDVTATASRSTEYVVRECPGLPVNVIELELRDPYKSATINHKTITDPSFTNMFGDTRYSGSTGKIDITNNLVGSNDQLRIAVESGRDNGLQRRHWKARLIVLVNGVVARDVGASCWGSFLNGDSDGGGFLLSVDKFSGTVSEPVTESCD